MYIYNVTIKMTWDIHDAWVQWMKETHIPEVMATGCFSSCRFARLLETDDSEGPTYTTQYYADTKHAYDTYIATFAPALRDAAYKQWGDQFVGFRSLMQIVN
jgi:hypothetical protein